MRKQQKKHRILFCNGAYMKKYDMDIINDAPVNGGEYVARTHDAQEKINFHEWGDGICRGYVESGFYGKKHNQIHIERIDDSCKNNEKISDVTVIFCAKSNLLNSTVVVGWYKHATVFRYEQHYDNQSYFIQTESKNAYLIPENDRKFIISRAKNNKFGFGQKQLWYADKDEAQPFVLGILNYLDAYKSNSTSIYIDEFESFTENATPKVISVAIRKRNEKARKACLKKNGTQCIICGFDSEEKYGTNFKGKIHVHHKIPISERDGKYELKEDDLVPVCPNCHMILHTKLPNGTFISVDDLEKIVKNRKKT